MNRRSSMKMTENAWARVLAGPTEPPHFKGTAGRQMLPAEFLMTFTDVAEGRNTYKVRNAELLSGDGSSCMCYLVSVEMSENEPHRMILKQFYPAAARPENVKMDGLTLTIDGFQDNAQLQIAAEHFANAYDLQRALSDIDELRSFVVTPYRRYFSGSTMYVLYERENGETLDRYFPRTAAEFLKIAISLAEAMAALHRENILYMDFKPENILWADMSRAMLFDFDAAIDLSDPDGIREIRGTERVLAPELKNPEDFPEKKALFLTPAADIYSYGATLIAILAGIWPSEAEAGTRWREAVNETLHGEFRGQLDDAETRELLRILSRCAAEDLMERYRSAEEVLADLRKLEKSVLRGKKAARRSALETERMLATAFVTGEYPLWKYRRPEAGGKYVIDAALAGDGDTAMRFFKYFLNTQIADTEMVIRWAVPDPYRKMKELARMMPALSEAAVFYVNGFEIYDENGVPTGRNREIAREPFAYIYLENWDPALDSAEDLFRLYSREEDGTLLPSWIVFADDRGDEAGTPGIDAAGIVRGGAEENRGVSTNKNMALRFLEAVAAHNGLTPDPESGRFFPVFVGYADADDPPGAKNAGFFGEKNGEIAGRMRAALTGSDMEFSRSDYILHKVDFASVGSSRGNGSAGTAYGRKMRKLAEKIHRFYMKDRDERVSKEEITRTFRRQQGYNLESSVCAALSQEAKLISAGIDPKAPNAAFLFHEKVLSGTPEANEQLEMQMYLEHRRWTAFMIAAGYRAPTPEELTEYAYNGTNDHRDLKRKLHPLICASDLAPRADLRGLPHSQWEMKEKWDEYDPLDRASLVLHALCSKKASQMDENHLTEELFADISKFDLQGEWIRAAEWLRTVIGKMLRGEANINTVFAEEIRAFRARIEGIDRRRTACRMELTEDIDRIESELRSVIFRNRFMNYKMTDEAMVRGLPLLIEQPVRRIYKPLAGMLWQNVMSSVIIEPEELVLIVENTDPVNRAGLLQVTDLLHLGHSAEMTDPENEEKAAEEMAEEIRHFLQEDRQLETKVTLLYGTDAVRADERSKRAVLDITGMSEADAFRYARRSIFQMMPVTYCKDGKLVDFGYGAELAMYSKQKHFTVDEALKVYGFPLSGEPLFAVSAESFPSVEQSCSMAAESVLSGKQSVSMAAESFLSGNQIGHVAEMSCLVGEQLSSMPPDFFLSGEHPNGTMAALRPYYGMLWEAHSSVTPLEWKIFTAEMEKQELRQYLKPAESFCEPRIVETAPVSGRMLTDTGIRRVLREWKKHGLIEAGLEVPTETKTGRIRFVTTRTETESVLAEMLRRAAAEPYCHVFEAESCRHYVYDRIALVHFTFRDESVRDSSGETVLKSEAVRKVLLALARSGDLIRPCGTKPLIGQECDSGEYAVTFEVEDNAVRQCLLKEENVRKAYIFHTIFQYVPVDDIRSNVDFFPYPESGDEPSLRSAVNREVDIICTKNMNIYFLSCK